MSLRCLLLFCEAKAKNMNKCSEIPCVEDIVILKTSITLQRKEG